MSKLPTFSIRARIADEPRRNLIGHKGGEIESPSAEKTDSDVMSITSIREAWLEAVKTGDARRLASLVADDVVVVHGNGRCVRGRDELEADFKNGFERFAIEQRVTSVEVLIQGHWAIEISEVESILTPVSGAAPTHVPSKTVVVFARQPNGSWKVARVLGLLDSPLRNATKA